ncbi:MAG: 2-hydroxyacyl-CoA dehydratase family protein [Polyangiaceae bacterium]|jgi:hypothetical protein|nr:2-hydroxyacyl-CoA dehydratase family protein [Polyangiaceae bacterium]
MSLIVKHTPHATRNDRLRSWAWSAVNWAKFARIGLQLGPRRMPGYLRRHPWIADLLRVNELHDRMTRGRTGYAREANGYVISNVVTSIGEMLDGAFNRPHQTVLHEDLVPPEILYGMGLHPWMAEFLGMVLPMIDSSLSIPHIDKAENEGVPPDVCSLPKCTLGLVLADQMPPPAAVVASNMPCDGGMAQYAIVKRKLKVPLFQLDVPYDFYDERAVDYFAGELRRMISFLEAHTPGRMDWDRMREVCEERNRAAGYELDLWDLLRCRPAPMAAEPIYLTHMVYGIAQPGQRRSTEVFRRVAELARANHERGQGAVRDEKHRVALWNPPTMTFLDLFAWAEQVWGVAMVMDMITFHRHPMIDTRTPDTMLRDLARIVMQGPMARHTRGPAENFFRDLFFLTEQFDLDMVWMAAHVGCKNTQALLGMLREKCRARGIPLLVIDYDLMDPRVEPPEGIRGQVDRFMQTVMREECRT